MTTTGLPRRAGWVLYAGLAVFVLVGLAVRLPEAAPAGPVPSNVGWFAVCVLGGWCAVAGPRAATIAFWAGALVLFDAGSCGAGPIPAGLPGGAAGALDDLGLRRRGEPGRLAAGEHRERRPRLLLADVAARSRAVLAGVTASVRAASRPAPRNRRED